MRAAYDFNSAFCATYTVQAAAGASGAAAGSSSAQPPLNGPPTAASRRCSFSDCRMPGVTDNLRECPCGSATAAHHHVCSIAAGCEEQMSRCAACLGVQVAEPAAAPIAPIDGGDAAEAEAEDDALEADAAAGWLPLSGGPWVARLMRPSRQPVAHANYRNFCENIGFELYGL